VTWTGRQSTVWCSCVPAARVHQICQRSRTMHHIDLICLLWHFSKVLSERQIPVVPAIPRFAGLDSCFGRNDAYRPSDSAFVKRYEFSWSIGKYFRELL